MKKLLPWLLCLLMAWGPAHANTYNVYTPAAGIQKNTGSTWINTPAAASDVAATYAGQSGCTGAAALLFNSTCTLFGTVTSVVCGTGLTGGTITTTGTCALSVPVSATNGGSGESGTITGVLKGNGTSPFSAALAADTAATYTGASGCTGAAALLFNATCVALTVGTVTSVMVTVPSPLTATGCTGTAILTCAITWTTGQTANQFLATPNGSTGPVGLRAIVAADLPGTITSNTSGNAATATALAANPTDCSANQYTNAIDAGGNLTCAQVAYSQLTGTPTVPTAANPAGSIGLSVVNGSATTYMRSDGHPPLDQSISPTWTNPHIFNGTVALNGAVTVGANIGGTSTAATYVIGADPVAGVFNGGFLDVFGSTAGAAAILGAGGAGTLEVTTTQIMGIGPVSGGYVDLTPDEGTFTGTYTGFTATVTQTCIWSRNGNQVTLVLAGMGTATSNATTFNITGIPAAIQPTHTQFTPTFDTSLFVNNGAGVGAYVIMTAASGTLQFVRAGGAAWTASSTKGLASPIVISYLLN